MTDLSKNQNVFILPVKNLVVFPHVVFPVIIEDAGLSDMVNRAMIERKDIGVFTEVPTHENQMQIYKIGTRSSILKMYQTSEGNMRLLLQGVERIKLQKVVDEVPYIIANIQPVASKVSDPVKCEALLRTLKSLMKQLVQQSPLFSEDVMEPLTVETDPGKFADLIATNLEISMRERQDLLEETSVDQRLETLLKIMQREMRVVEVTGEIQNRLNNQMDQSQREFILREQLKVIQDELGDGDEEDEWDVEINDLRKQIKKLKMPADIEAIALKEVERMSEMSPVAAEYTISRTYVDWLIAMPWNAETKDSMDLKHAKKILDEDHYNLEDVKNRILEFLAVRKLKKKSKGPILCFAGPPGVGKTSLGRSIARAMGRKFVRYSVGGVRDEAEIRGHRRTYIGALPGRIIQMIKEAGTANPVFMLDEIDKIGNDFRGDPASALLEALDPEQNQDFVDHYLDVKFDLSRVMFITTANVLYDIPPALLDRMEVIEIPGYTTEDKVHIARKYLVPRQIEENGLKKSFLKFRVSAIEKIILDYTNEAGVRNLEREIANICRKEARQFAEGKTETVIVTDNEVPEYLGPPKMFQELAGIRDEIGIATGLAWTPVGGEILLIESTMMTGGKNLSLTGQLGEVMRESAHAALSYLRTHASEYDIDPEFYQKNDIHIHVPSGAVPKDGPSAGVTIATSLLSLLTRHPIRHDVAMTGEISLRGRVLPVGGIKEKVLAARRAGIKTVILPSRNEKDLQEIPENIRKKMNFIFAEKLCDVFKNAIRNSKWQKEEEKTARRKKKVAAESKKKGRSARI